jgi:hypothetical protein
VNAIAERDHLLMAPTAFKEQVCNWIGVVSDGFVGISDLSSPTFAAILDESDSEE